MHKYINILVIHSASVRAFLPQHLVAVIEIQVLEFLRLES